MSTPTAEPHALALQSALVAAGLDAGIGEAPEGAEAPYVVLYSDPGIVRGTLGDPYRTLDMLVQITAVGVGPEQALQQQDRARTALVGTMPVVTGRALRPIRQADAQPVRRDDGVQPPLHVATAQYRIVSDPQ